MSTPYGRTDAGALPTRRDPRDPRDPRPGRVRLTRRGRAVLAGLGLLAGALVTGLGAEPAPAAGTAEPVEQVVVVAPGDTLWSLAARHAPSRDVPGMMEEIRRRNDLAGHTLFPGQELVLPVR